MRSSINIFRVFLLLLFALSCSEGVYAQKQSKKAKASFWKKAKVSKSGKQKGQAAYKNPKDRSSDVAWKAVRLEYTLMTGISGFLGDLGGQDGVGQPFLLDYDPTQSRYAISAGARYFFRENQAIRGMFSYARVSGSDSKTNYPNRRFRNITFRSPIIELSAVYEWHIIKPQYKHFAGAPTTRVFAGNRLGVYLYGGVGIFGFNPKGPRDGEWYALRPLGTEGQGLPDGPKPYSLINMSVPMGFGTYILFNHNVKVGFDVGYRWTTTDYIDDAGGYYYNNDEIRASYGQIAAYFANPSVGLDNVPNPDWYTESQPRGGFESNDTYFFAQVTVSKNLGPSISNKKIQQSKRKKGRSYKSKKVKNAKRKFRMPSLEFKGKNKGKRKKGGVTTF